MSAAPGGKSAARGFGAALMLPPSDFLQISDYLARDPAH